MKRVLLIALVLSPALSLLSQQEDSDGQDVKVVLPGSVPPTEEQIRTGQLIREVGKKLPYKGNWVEGSSTLGVLCKTSDNIFIGSITHVNIENADGSKNEKQRGDRIQDIEMSVETNILGQLSKPAIALSERWPFCQCTLNSRERAIVFLSHKMLSPYPSEARRWDFDVSTVVNDPSDKIRLQGKDRGIITVSSEKIMDEYVGVLTGYIENLRQGKKDPERYYTFLCGLMKSSNSRIKEDARSDMLDFIRSCQAIDLNRILNDEIIDDGIKEYVRHILTPSREKKEQKEGGTGGHRGRSS